MKAIGRVVAFGVVELAVFGLVLFLLAGTVDYWQVWTFLVVFALSTWIPAVYLQRADPAAHQRRKRAGPVAQNPESAEGTHRKLVFLPDRDDRDQRP
ncbi:conserved integral membrane protein [Mycobacteroides abscessus]|nr:conserved integral membrane protein [Mycobacteroides abscessus]